MLNSNGAFHYGLGLIKVSIYWFDHSHKKRKYGLEGSLDRVLFAAELAFPILVLRY